MRPLRNRLARLEALSSARRRLRPVLFEMTESEASTLQRGTEAARRAVCQCYGLSPSDVDYRRVHYGFFGGSPVRTYVPQHPRPGCTFLKVGELLVDL